MAQTSNRFKFLVVVLLAIAWASQVLALRCVHSGMCSVGQLQPFMGDIGTSEGLKAALAARSFNREVIVVVTSPHHVLAARMCIENFAALGIEHILLLAANQGACEEVARHMPHIGCAWELYEVGRVQVGSVRGLWKMRYRVLARATRMGYNVLVTDSDVVVWDDLYRYFKAPPFDQYHVINQPEVLYDPAAYLTNTRPNGGFIYVQNIRPDGPTAYMLAETELRFLRWADDNFNFTKAKGLHNECNEVDQDALSDALSSVATGRPHFVHASSVCWVKPGRGVDKLRVEARVRDEVAAAWKLDRAVALPYFMHQVAGGPTTPIRWLPMVLPHTEGVWPEEYGGQWYPLGPLGPHASHFLHLLGNDTDSPLWPDPEDPTTLSAARAGPKEQYAYAPPWLVLGYHPRGSDGVWLPDEQGVVQQVIGHAHYLPTTDTRMVGKHAVRQAVGRYDWTLAHAMAAASNISAGTGEDVYLANQFSGDVRNRNRTRVQSVPKLLVLHPRMHMDALTSYPQLFAVLHGAMQVAALSSRTLVWPDLSCKLPWIGSYDPTTKALQQARRGEWFAFGQRTPGAMRCMFARVMRPGCMGDHRGMLATEWHHYRERWGVRHDLVPHAGNTAFFPVHDALATLLRLGPTSPSDLVVAVPAENATAHLQALDGAPVVYLAHPVQVCACSFVRLLQWTKPTSGACPPSSFSLYTTTLCGVATVMHARVCALAAWGEGVTLH